MDMLPTTNYAEVRLTKDEPRICEKCGKKMVKRSTGVILTSYPAQYPWYWWCGCGNKADGGIDRGITAEEGAMIEWKELNK